MKVKARSLLILGFDFESFGFFFFLGFLGMQDRLKMPTSPWISFPALISALSKYVPPTAMNLISKYYRDHKVSFY